MEIEFWNSIKNSIRASEYEAYLDQCPEGSFVALALVRLEAIGEDAVGMRIRTTGRLNCHFGNLSARARTSRLIQAYLQKYPNGEFSALAQIRIGELNPESQAADRTRGIMAPVRLNLGRKTGPSTFVSGRDRSMRGSIIYIRRSRESWHERGVHS